MVEHCPQARGQHTVVRNKNDHLGLRQLLHSPQVYATAVGMLLDWSQPVGIAAISNSWPLGGLVHGKAGTRAAASKPGQAIHGMAGPKRTV